MEAIGALRFAYDMILFVRFDCHGKWRGENSMAAFCCQIAREMASRTFQFRRDVIQCAVRGTRRDIS